MSRRPLPHLILVMGLAIVAGLTTGRAASQDVSTRPAPPAADLAVTLQHVGGQVDAFRDELVRMELILDPGGRLDQVHLVTRTGPEADTHIWYNVDNLVSVRYQFLAITGKGKVAVRTLAAPQVKPSAAPARPAIRPLEPEDYR